ncbi:c-type cytochrome [Luteibacter sp. OK325]|uniref:c-type cytochrome n=1 Tax=Luteibacter sp. OK325 TaxID=2135670 RepID=UPI001E5AB689|nr:c-type cytochrome [Luteibacter sp. OK325]
MNRERRGIGGWVFGRYVAGAAACLALFILAAPLRAQTRTTVTAPDTIATRVMACTTCHGLRGEGSNDDYFPRLAGKPAGYLYNQLIAFRDGQRKYAPMNYLLEYLPDAYLQEMAGYFAQQQTPFPTLPKPDVPPAVMALGQKLTVEGDARRHIPSCVACHGASLTGVSPDIPGLLGLRAKYISAQLGASRYGARVSAKPNCMQKITVLLSDADIAATSAYLSSLPYPANPAPATEGSLALALTCHSSDAR